VTESGKGSGRKVVLAYCPATFADERLVPQSVLQLVPRMIVLPEDSYDGNEGRRREDRIKCDGPRRCGHRTRHDAADINDKSDE
jgi:hypothetical protein